MLGNVGLLTLLATNVVVGLGGEAVVASSTATTTLLSHSGGAATSAALSTAAVGDARPVSTFGSDAPTGGDRWPPPREATFNGCRAKCAFFARESTNECFAVDVGVAASPRDRREAECTTACFKSTGSFASSYG